MTKENMSVEKMSVEKMSVEKMSTEQLPPRLRLSLGVLITLLICVFIVVVTALNVAVSQWQQMESAKELVMQQSRVSGILVAAGSSDGITFKDRRLLERAANGAQQLPNLEWLIIRSAEGDTLYTHNFARVPVAFQNGASLMPLDSVRTVMKSESGNVLVAVPVHGLVLGERIGEVLLEFNTSEMQFIIARSRNAVVFSSLVALVIVALLAFFFAVRVAQPLTELARVAERVTTGDLSQRAPRTRNVLQTSESVTLLYSFNQMMDSLEEATTVMAGANRTLAESNQAFEESNAHLELRTLELSIAGDRITAQNQVLQDLSNEKDELMGIAAHDLKNPLSAIQGLSEVILSDADNQILVREMATVIHTTSVRMFELIRNLLDVNALESGGWHYTMLTLNLGMTARLITGFYEERAREKSITLHCTVSDDAYILADEVALGQILENLLSNAVKYSPHGKNVYVRVVSSPTFARFEVQDEGPGVSAEDMPKLFGKFARLSARPTGGEHSTGLGLSIVKKMVEAMEGRVWCESELSRGAVFAVEFHSVPAPIS
jgi:signal transduction histidine kinase